MALGLPPVQPVDQLLSSGWNVGGLTQTPQGPQAVSQRDYMDLTTMIDKARQRLAAMDPKYARANDAAILDKILSDRTLFVGTGEDGQIRRTIERLGRMQRSVFGPAAIAPEPPKPAPRPTIPAMPPRQQLPVGTIPMGGGNPGYVQFTQQDQDPRRVGLSGRITNDESQLMQDRGYGGPDNPTAQFARDSGMDPFAPPETEMNGPGSGGGLPGLMPGMEYRPHESGGYGVWNSETGQPHQPQGNSQYDYGHWAPQQQPQAPPPIQIGDHEVDEDTGIEYVFNGGDAGLEESWSEYQPPAAEPEQEVY